MKPVLLVISETIKKEITGWSLIIVMKISLITNLGVNYRGFSIILLQLDVMNSYIILCLFNDLHP